MPPNPVWSGYYAIYQLAQWFIDAAVNAACQPTYGNTASDL